MNPPKISIIVPVYNASKYLHRCINSFLAQTLTNFELLLIDDGSKDDSGIICDEYAQKDKRIKVIHKKNGGVASARQCGIEQAIGEYTIHSDPDDWVESDMLEVMYNNAKKNNADIVLTDFFTETKEGQRYTQQRPQSLRQEDILKDLLMVRLHGSCWNKLVKSNLYKRHNIGFIPGINMCEDILFWFQILQSQPLTIAYVNKAWYHYDKTINENSISNNMSKSSKQSLIAYIDEVDKLVRMTVVSKEKGHSILYTLLYLLKNGTYYKKAPYYFHKYRKSIKMLPISSPDKYLIYLGSKCNYTLYALYIAYLIKYQIKNIKTKLKQWKQSI